MTRKIVAYKIVNLPLHNTNDWDLECEIENDWQPYGNPVYVPGGDPVYGQGSYNPIKRPDRFVQAMVLYEDKTDQNLIEEPAA
jgi:hypothetical protein